MSVASNIKNRIIQSKKGAIFCANDFTMLGTRGNIDIILHRLSQDGTIRKLGYGLYDLPIQSPTLGALSPDIKQVMSAYMRKTGHIIVLDSLNAANSLNLTPQVPSQIVFKTNGSSCVLDICGIKIKLIHSSPKKMVGAGTTVGIIIQALQYFGRNGAPRNILNRVKSMLQKDDIKLLSSLKHQTVQYIMPQIDWIVRNAGK